MDKLIETNNFMEQIKTISVFLADENSTKVFFLLFTMINSDFKGC